MLFQILLFTAAMMATSSPPTQAFPQGAPGYACKTLSPSHLGSPKTQAQQAAPYRVSTNTTSLLPGGTARVQVTAPGSSFKGFLCAASDMTDSGHSPLGEMSMSEGTVCVLGEECGATTGLLKLQTCTGAGSNTGATHQSRVEKTEAAFHWTSPGDATPGQQFKLRCVIVQDTSNCWNDYQVVLSISDTASTQQQQTSDSSTACSGNCAGFQLPGAGGSNSSPQQQLAVSLSQPNMAGSVPTGSVSTTTGDNSNSGAISNNRHLNSNGSSTTTVTTTIETSTANNLFENTNVNNNNDNNLGSPQTPPSTSSLVRSVDGTSITTGSTATVTSNTAPDVVGSLPVRSNLGERRRGNNSGGARNRGDNGRALEVTSPRANSASSDTRATNPRDGSSGNTRISISRGNDSSNTRVTIPENTRATGSIPNISRPRGGLSNFARLNRLASLRNRNRNRNRNIVSQQSRETTATQQTRDMARVQPNRDLGRPQQSIDLTRTRQNRDRIRTQERSRFQQNTPSVSNVNPQNRINQNPANRNALNEGFSLISERINRNINRINQNVNSVFENSNTISDNIDTFAQEIGSSFPSSSRINEPFFQRESNPIPSSANRLDRRINTQTPQRDDSQRNNEDPESNNVIRQFRRNGSSGSRNTSNRRSQNNNINSVQSDTSLLNSNLVENNLLFESPRRSRMIDLIRSSQRVRPASFNNRFF